MHKPNFSVEDFFNVLTAGVILAVIATIFTVDTRLIGPFHISKPMALEGVTFSIFIFFIITYVFKKAVREKVNTFFQENIKNPIFILIYLFILTHFFSWSYSLNSDISFYGSYFRRSGLILTLCCLSYFFISALVINNNKDFFNRFKKIFILVMGLQSIFAIMQMKGINLFLHSESAFGRAAGSLGNPMILGTLLMIAIPIAIDEIFRNRKSYSYLLLALLIIALYLTGSRGPLLGALLASSYLIFTKISFANKIKAVSTIISLLIIGILLGIYNLRIRVSPLDTLITRTVIWQAAIDGFKTSDPIKNALGETDPFSPIRKVVGFGQDMQSVLINKYVSPQINNNTDSNKDIDRAHNIWLDTILTNGILGVLLIYFIFMLSFVNISNLNKYKLFKKILLCGMPAVLGIISFLVFTNLNISFSYYLASLIAIGSIFVYMLCKSKASTEGHLLIAIFLALLLDLQTSFFTESVLLLFFVFIAFTQVMKVQEK